MAKKNRYRQATLGPMGRDTNAQWKGSCPACMDRGRRGGQAIFKAANSMDRNGWWTRHKEHHIPKPEEYGLRAA